MIKLTPALLSLGFLLASGSGSHFPSFMRTCVPYNCFPVSLTMTRSVRYATSVKRPGSSHRCRWE